MSVSVTSDIPMPQKLLLSGADVKVIQAQLGHARIGVTLDTVAHLLPSIAKAAVRKRDDTFGSAKKKVNLEAIGCNRGL